MMSRILGTWKFASYPLRESWPVLCENGAMAACVHACAIAESDPSIDSVGTGGRPDARGGLTLDASVMESPSRAGGVCAVSRHLHVARIARGVMEKTSHYLLAGAGADEFADSIGEPPSKLLPAAPAGAVKSECRWHDHDTIGVVAVDGQGRMAGACSTSGLAGKLHGRVGDSPIIGHGLYVDPRVGAVTATGNGELIMGVCGSFLAVECMRRGASPVEALREVLERIQREFALAPNHQVALIALCPDGSFATAALRSDFHAVTIGAEGEKLLSPDLVLRDD